jgi:hypothetical protein
MQEARTNAIFQRERQRRTQPTVQRRLRDQREKSVQLYRTYRDGELPDIQMSALPYVTLRYLTRNAAPAVI